MRIIGFASLISAEYLRKRTLKDCEVAVDATNFFYQTYKKSGLHYLFGCECDAYATFLRSVLDTFKRANVRAYFFFKGGDDDPTKILKKNINRINYSAYFKNFDAGGCTEMRNKVAHECVQPLLVHDVIKQVLEEMGFDFVICEFDAKRECIAFAQKHNCPIISYDVEFCFSGVPYIPINCTYKFNFDFANCGIFYLDDFLNKCHLTDEKLAIFIVLTDLYLFPENTFIQLGSALKLPLQDYSRNRAILKWLSYSKSTDQVIEIIFEYINAEDQKLFLDKLNDVKAFIRRQETPGLPTQFIEKQNFQITQKDSQWFMKGVAAKHITPPFVNLFHWKIIWGSSASRHKHSPDAILLCLDIFKYALNLLTNFRTDEIKVICDTMDPENKEEIVVPLLDLIPQPNCTHDCGYFENGWDQVRSFPLFDHFLTFQGIQLKYLEPLPEDVKLLIIALAYFTHQKAESTVAEVCSVLVSYVLLNELSLEECSKELEVDITRRPILDPSTDRSKIEVADKRIAKSILAEYSSLLSMPNAAGILNRLWLHPLVEFQHCLEYLNHLNTLCGRPYQPTVYSKTFNGTVVYRFLYAIKWKRANAEEFLENKLNPAPTVLAFFKGLVNAYEKVSYG